MENKYLYMIAAAGLFALLLYKELKRPDKSRLFLRVLAAAALVNAVLGLALPWKYTVPGSSSPQQLRLLTRGALTRDLKDADWFTLDSAVLREAGLRQVKYIPDLAYYLAENPDIHTVQVEGYGLTGDMLQAIKGYEYQFHPAPLPLGIISCSWQQQINASTPLRVQGIYRSGSRPLKLYLEGQGGRQDSVSIAAGATTRFALTVRPIQTGKAVFTLVALSGKDTLARENVPFNVHITAKVKVLILSSFPDFEYKFLKNWLYENQYPVVFRARISKDKFTTEQLNTTALNAAVMDVGTLRKYDLVIADDEELSKLEPSAVSAFHAAMASGLGVLVRLNDGKPLSVLASDFRFSTTTDSAAGLMAPHLDDEGSALSPLPQSEGFYILPQIAEKSLVTDAQARVLVSSRLYGIGRIAVSAISSTYSWVLKSEEKDYNAFWSAIISTVARKNEQNFRWETRPEKVIAGENASVFFDSESGDSLPQVMISNHHSLPLQHHELSYHWKSDFLPEQSGWNALKVDGHTGAGFYVYDRTAWQSLRDAEMLNRNKLRSLHNEATKQNSVSVPQKIPREISRWWFFALFLLAAGFLWFETKML